MNKVFIYVGHSNWGKSRALKIITGNSSQKKTTQINSHKVRVRKMSNDDNKDKLLEWVKLIPKQTYKRFIIAFCPHVPLLNSNPTTEQTIALNILTELKSNNILYFFVQEEKFGFPQAKITSAEIQWLRSFGTVQILSGQNIDTTRSNSFYNFISANI